MAPQDEVRRSVKHQSKMRWLAENEAALEAEYPGMWVAISDNGLAGVGDTADGAQADAESHACRETMVAYIKPRELQQTYIICGFRVPH